MLIVGVLAITPCPAMAEPPISVEAQNFGAAIRLSATVLMDDVSPGEVWDVLTDYEGQLHFVPGLAESRVISRNSSGSVVVQKGWIEVLFLRFNFEVEYVTHEKPPRLLTSRVKRGNVKRMTGEYRLSKFTNGRHNGTRLDYVGEVEPEGWLPPLLGPMVMRSKVKAQIGAMVQEIERRKNMSGQP